MSELKLEGGVHALLETQLDSFEKLEIMLVLHAAKQPMSPEDVATGCQLGPEVVGETLKALERGQWIAHDERGRVGPGHRCTDRSFGILMRIYAEERTDVLTVLSSVAVQRIRSMAVTAFADVLVHKKRGNEA